MFETPSTQFVSAFPDQAERLRHRLGQDPRFSLEALLDLAKRLPPASIEYNAGDLPIDQDPDKTPANGLSIEETILRIREHRSWMVMRNVEADADYRAAMEACLAPVAPLVQSTLGRMHHKQAYIFISSPQSVTPLHMDPEHNILMQVSGEKTMIIYPAEIARALPPVLHEAYHAGAAHRNLRYDPDYEAQARGFSLGPGDAVYVPVKAPHRVNNGSDVSVSFSITWRSRKSVDEAELHLANRRLRLRGGQPPPPGEQPLRDGVVLWADRILRRISRIGG